MILGRQQLFTENTLTPILPLLEKRVRVTVGNVLRLWGVVLAANLIGCAIVGFVIAKSGALEPPIRAAVAEIGRETIRQGFGTIVLRGIFAGWLIALIVWLLPFAEAGRFWVIIAITYVIGIAHFSHGIAGSVDVFALASVGDVSWGEALGKFSAASLLGNIIGGVALVACLNHAQVVAGTDE